MKWIEIVCWVRGHRDKRTTPLGIKSATCVECQRCGRVGWLI